jgi:hypothetical protein
VLAQVSHEPLDEVRRDCVHARVVVAEVRKIPGVLESGPTRAIFAPDGLDHGVLDRGEAVSHDGEPAMPKAMVRKMSRSCNAMSSRS